MSTLKSTIRYAAALIGFAAFVWGIWIVGSDGLSSLMVRDALDKSLIASADKAISFNSANPDAYRARASLYRNDGQNAEAIRDFERAVELRPGDHFLRLELGFTRYQTGDISGATADFGEAVRLAPFYAQPRWYLGNMLLQAGRVDEGFTELRRAVESDPVYLPDTIQRAAEAFDGNPGAIARAIEPRSPTVYLALERYFIKQDDIPEAMELFRTEKDKPANDLRTLLSDLLTAKRFTEAHEVWLVKHGEGSDRQSGRTFAISNGGFESEIDPDASGFEWQIGRPLERVSVSRDSGQFQNGAYSLRIDYNGNSNPSTTIVSQIVLVEPNTDYRLSFAAQTRGMVTGGLPFVNVTDGADGQVLAQSSALPEGTTRWRNYEIECKTAAATRAVVIGIERRACSSAPCPAFGHVWFDDFTWQSR